MTKAAPAHLEILDGLRGLAILLVLLLHYFEITWLDIARLCHSPVNFTSIAATGYSGVLLFFFVSAFCLSLPYARAFQEGTPPPTLRHFFARRAVKIIPSYYLALGLLMLLPQPDIAPERFWFNVGVHLLFVHNWFYDTTGSFNGVFWSLAVEVQFYLLFPFLMKAWRKSALVTISVMVGLSRAWGAFNVARFRSDNDINLFDWRDLHVISYLDIFAAGIGAAFLYVRWCDHPKRTRFAPVATVVAVVGFLAFFAEMYICYTTTAPTGIPLRSWQIQYRPLVAFTFFLMALGSAFAVRPFRALVANRILVFLSLISYNLYLWHQVIARFLLSASIPPYRTPDPHDDVQWQISFTIIAWSLSIVAALGLTFYWERLFMRKRSRTTPKETGDGRSLYGSSDSG